MSDRDLFARLCEIIDRQRVSEWQGGIHPEDVGHLARALITAGVNMPAPPEGETDRALCWCGESAESTGWGVCEKHFEVDRCNKPQGDPGRFCALSSGHDGRCI